jgi:hypothetical protein
MSCGAVDSIDTSAAPAPNDTSKAGIAQQIKVLSEKNRVAKGKIFLSIWLTFDIEYLVSCITN